MPETPAWIRAAREKWKYRGQERPAFAESPQVGQESVWDYPRPPRMEADSREVAVRWQDVVIAETNRSWRVLETASPPTYYLPPEDVRFDLLEASPRGSICEWKGRARYWNVLLPDAGPLQDAAWSYEEPFQGFEQLAGYLAFYPGVLDCYVDGNRAEPQPGNVYGGWVTPEVIGPFKGEPGTEDW